MVATKLYTAYDLLLMGEDARFELVRGELREVAAAAGKHGRTTMRVAAPLAIYAAEHGLGEVYAAETGFVIEVGPDTVLAPDVSFVRAERMPSDDAEEHFMPVVPDLVVEVVSPSDRRARIEEKIALYLGAGVPLLWLVEPRHRTVTAHRPGQPPRVFTENDILEGEEIVPGFRLAVGEIYRPALRTTPVSGP